MEGLIYKTIDYKEKSKLIYLYTPLGLDSFLAQGAKDYKKGLLSFSEIITYVKYETRGNNLKALGEFEIINSFKNIKNSLKALGIAEAILEIARQTNDERNERIFRFTLNTLLAIEDGKNYFDIFFIYLIKMLKVFGVLDLDFKGLPNSLRDKAILAYEGDLNSKLAVSKDDLNLIIGYYEHFDIIYLKNIKQSLRLLWTKKNYMLV